MAAYPRGFNSKSTADGPEPSIYTQIDAAIKERWRPLYAGLAPRELKYVLDPSDRSAYSAEIKAALRKKLKYAGIAVVLGLIAHDPGSGLGILWFGVIGYALAIFFIWPDSPQKRADARAAADYQRAEAEARQNAAAILIEQLASELGLPEEGVATAYRDAPDVVRRRNQLREKFRRQNAWLRYRAGN